MLFHLQGEPVPVYPKQDKMTFIRMLADTLIKDINITGTLSENFGYKIDAR